jgi:hypothetical protein
LDENNQRNFQINCLQNVAILTMINLGFYNRN